MTSANKVELLNAIERLRPLSSTNLWDGLETGMDLILAAQRISTTPTNQQPTPKQNRLTTLFLLTDGMPNVSPPGGHIPALRTYLDTRSPSSTLSFTINTFGFGYSIDTPLLLDIARVGGGGYNFIPEVGMVGTVFVNAVASAYAAYAQHVKLDVQLAAPGGTFVNREDFEIEVKGKVASTRTTRGVRVDAGDVQYGQPKYYVLDFSPSLPPSIRVYATYRPVTSSSVIQSDPVELSSDKVPTKQELVDIEYHAATFTLASILLNTTAENRDASANALKDLQTRLKTEAGLSEHPDADALARDVGGEALTSVVSSAHFERWGKHYGPSYAVAHQRQQCQNFKDSGLKSYGISPVFQRERNKLGNVFQNSPAPTPSSQAPPPPIGQNMFQYPSPSPANSSSGTFSGFSSPSTPDSSMFGRTPSPQYRPMFGQFSQYAPEQVANLTASQSSRASTVSRLRNFIAQRRSQQQSPLNGYGPPPYLDPKQQQQQWLDVASQMLMQESGLPPVPNAPTTAFPPGVSPSPMSSYYDPEAPCFAGRCLVDVVDVHGEGTGLVRVDELKRGMTVRTLGGPRKVAAVLRTGIGRGELLLCRLGELEITAWHPVRLVLPNSGASWVFPARVVKPVVVPCDAVYSVLLEKGEDNSVDAHSISISGVWCVTLGHGIVKDGHGTDVRAHAFFGNYERVVREMSKLDGFFEEDGVVGCEGLKRGNDGLVCGFVGKTIGRGDFVRGSLTGLNTISV
jgi:hypothetical protein